MKRPALILSFCLAAAGSVASLGGCKLIDQRTFNRTADKPPVAHLNFGKAGPAGPSSSLVTIGFPSDPSEWTDQLKVAVGLAVSRKPNVLFTVQSVVPAKGTPAAEADALTKASSDARAVADAIEADGVDRGQIELIAATDASAQHEEIRVTVR